MALFEINGGRKLKGRVEIMGSKNAALPLIAASLLTKDECVIKNVPPIEDVKVLVSILQDIGVDASWQDGTVRIIARKISKHKLDAELTRRLRASVLLMGPLLARLGSMEMIHPGGCVIGTRPVGTHFEALEALGATIGQDQKNYYLSAKKLSGADIYLDEQSVTATENAIMAASLAKGKTIIKNAAAERHIVSLCEFLNKMGAKITGQGTTTIEISGINKLYGAQAVVPDDEIEIGTMIALALGTKSKLALLSNSFLNLEPIFHRAVKMGARFKISQKGRKEEMQVLPPKIILPSRIQCAPWPGFPTDLQAPFAVASTQAEGSSLVHDWMFERRLFYCDELSKMGANITICDPHRAIINGPTRLFGTHIISPDIRAGMALVIAALIAKGKTTIENVELIERGYYNIEERLISLGADIKRID